MDAAATINPQDAIDQMVQAAVPLQSVDPTMQFADQTVPQPGQPTPAAPATGPESTAPPWTGQADPNTIEAAAAAVHHGRLARTLDAVGNLLGGDQTIHITKKPDGSVEVVHDPSTSGEKWGRIAQAALGGLAQGFAAGPGPGGIGRAGAGGITAGMQMPQQREDQAKQDVAFDDKRQQDHANLVSTQQRLVAQTLANTQAGLQLTKDEQDQSNDEQDRYVNSPNSFKVGEFASVHDAATSANAAMLLKAHPNGTLRTATAFDSKGKITGVHAYVVDRAWGDRINDAPRTYLEQVPSEDPDAPPQFKVKTIPVGADKNSKVDNFADAKNLAAQTAKQNWAKTQKELNPPPTTDTALAVAAQTEKDPIKRAQYAAAEQQRQQEELKRAAAGHAVNNIGSGWTPSADATSTTPSGAPVVGKQWGGGDPNSAFERVAQMLQKGKMVLSQVRQMRGKGNAQQQDFLGRADQIDRELGGPGLNPTSQEERYKARQATEKDYSAAGNSGKKIESFSTLLEHLGDMSDNADELRRTGSPWLNKPINDLDKSILGGTKVGPAELRTSAPAHEFANVLNNNYALNNDEKAAAAKSLNTAMTPAMLQANAKQMAKTSIERLAPVFQGYRTTMNGEESPSQLTPRAIQTLHSLGLYDYYMKEAHGVAAPSQGQVTAPHAPAARDAQGNITVPPGAIPGKDKKTGALIGYQDANGWHQ